MSKRILLIIFLALVLIAIVITENIFVSNTLDYLKTETYEINQLIIQENEMNIEAISEKIEQFSENWSKKENILCLVINHNDLEKIGEQTEKLKVLVKQNKKEEAEYESALLYFFAESYEHIISASFQNIF